MSSITSSVTSILTGGATDAAAGASADATAVAQEVRTETAEQSQELLDFNQGLLDDWEDMFGGLEQNLTDYYSNLDPVKFATQNKQQIGAELDKQLSQFNDTMASQGLMTSGMKAQAEKELAFTKATSFAAADINAPEQVAQAQAGFLAQQKPAEAQAIAGVQSAYNTQIQSNIQSGSLVTGAYGAEAAGFQQEAGQTLDLWGTAIGAGIGAGT